MLKKISVISLCILLALSLIGCGGGNSGSGKSSGTGKVDTSLQKGEPSAPGDVFSLPSVKRSGENAPTIIDVTAQAKPDDTVIVTGEGFSESGLKAYVYSQTDKDNGKAHEAQFTVTDEQNMMVIVDKSLPYGMYGVYVETSKGTSNIKLVNKPVIWWVGLSYVSAGESLNIYGENLTTENGDKSNVYLVSDDGRFCGAEITFADPYKVTITIPDNLKDGQKYTVRLHNGHGGENGFADAKEQITYHKNPYKPFTGKKINVTDFGADPADKNNDDSAAVQKAVNSASEEDTIYFPAGTYTFKNRVNVTTGMRFIGDGKNKSILMCDNSLEKQIFNVKTGPVEFAGLGFANIRKSGKLQSQFINYDSDKTPSDTYSVWVHDCKFVQSVSKTSRSGAQCMALIRCYGAIIENNDFECTQVAWTNDAEKVVIRNNNIVGVWYCGQYYNQNMFLFWSSEKFDVCDNKIIGKKGLTDDSGTLVSDDFTAGRAFAAQGYSRNMYISGNDISKSGLPSDNAGEEVLFEHVACEYWGGIKSATATELIMPDDFTKQIKKGMLVAVSSGKGKTQVRGITKMQGKTITVSEPWDIIPDSSSKVLMSSACYNLAVHNNNISGYTNYGEKPGATCGVQAYATIYNMYITGNTFKDMPYGICLSTHYVPTADHPNQSNYLYNVIVDDNTIDNVGIGIRFNTATLDGTGNIIGTVASNCTIRNNAFSNVAGYTEPNWKGSGGVGIALGTIDAMDGFRKSNTWTFDWIDGNLIENNTFSGCPVADVYFYKHQGNNVLRNNKGAGGGDISYKISPIGNGPILFNK